MATGSTPSKEEKKLINLLRGWPSPSLLPAETLKAAANIVLSNPDIYVPGLQYGADPGYQPLREELATFLSQFYNTTRDPERICITGGASQNMACILQSYTDPAYTKAVWAVAPCYYLACAVFEDSGFKGRLHAVPEDKEGIDLAFLKRGLDEFSKNLDPHEKPIYKDPSDRKVYRHIIYCVPSAANPSGKTMSLRRRTALVHLARKHNALIVADDVYDFLQWPVSSSSPLTPITPLPRLSDIDFALGPPSDSEEGAQQEKGKWFGNAVSNGSFSKIVGPGIRTGWTEATRDFTFGLAQTGSTKSGGAPSQLASTMVCEMLRSGQLAAHIDGECRPALRRRHALLMREVKERLVKRFGVDVLEGTPDADGGLVYGGYFVWLTFPEEAPAAVEIARVARERENLILSPGKIFEVSGDEGPVRFERSIRLCFSWEAEEDMVEGVVRLERVVESLWGKDAKAVGQENVGGEKFDAFW